MTRKTLSLACAQFGLEALDKLSVDALILTPFEDDQPLKGAAGYCDWRLNGRLSRMILSGNFTGEPQEVLLTDTGNRIGTQRILLFGQGKRKDMDLDLFEQRVQALLPTIKKAGIESYAIELPGVHPGPLSLPQVFPTFLDVATSMLPELTATLLCPPPRSADLIKKMVAKDNRVSLVTDK